MPGSQPPAVGLTSMVRKILEQMTRCYTDSYALVLRAKIILSAAERIADILNAAPIAFGQNYDRVVANLATQPVAA